MLRGRPRFVAVTMDVPVTLGGAGKASLSVSAPVRLTAPPPSQVIDGSKLGMTGSSVPSFI